jgi:glycine cleavage system aminomethyltransferase T
MSTRSGAESGCSPVSEEQLHPKRVGILDQTSFGKLRVRGPRRRCAARARVRQQHRQADLHAMLNRKGGFESDVTVQRWATMTSFVVTGSAQPCGTAGC